MNTHVLKTEERFFSALANGSKTFEIRRNDRGFQVGDILHLVEVASLSGVIVETGRALDYKITYIANDPRFVLPGFVVLAIKKVEK